MGTRNATIVMAGGEYRVAQYGQWDGYPEGQGKKILNFLRNHDVDLLGIMIRKCRFLTEEETDKLDQTNWKQTHPQLSRDVGGDILEMIYRGVNELVSALDFVGDSSCEWAYVVDLDKHTFEVYHGYNKEPLELEDRFHNIPLTRDNGCFYQVKLIKSFDLDRLPTEEAFLKSFHVEEETIED